MKSDLTCMNFTESFYSLMYVMAYRGFFFFSEMLRLIFLCIVKYLLSLHFILGNSFFEIVKKSFYI